MFSSSVNFDTGLFRLRCFVAAWRVDFVESLSFTVFDLTAFSLPADFCETNLDSYHLLWQQNWFHIPIFFTYLSAVHFVTAILESLLFSSSAANKNKNRWCDCWIIKIEAEWLPNIWKNHLASLCVSEDHIFVSFRSTVHRTCIEIERDKLKYICFIVYLMLWMYTTFPSQSFFNPTKLSKLSRQIFSRTRTM